jgi:hypothetical protein
VPCLQVICDETLIMMLFEFLVSNMTTLSHALIPALEKSATQIRLCLWFPVIYVPLCVDVCYFKSLFHSTCLFDMLAV